MTFWINEDNPTERAIVQRGACVYATEREKLPENGQWHGPYGIRDEALNVAATLGQRTVKVCHFCKHERFKNERSERWT